MKCCLDRDDRDVLSFERDGAATLMRGESYFLITPGPQLIARLSSLDDDELVCLDEPVMWMGEEGGRGGFSLEEMEIFVKALFLDTLRRVWGDAAKFASVFPGFQTSSAFFDSLWTMRRVEIDMTVKIAIADAAASGTLARIAPTGSEREQFEITQESLGCAHDGLDRRSPFRSADQLVTLQGKWP